MNIIQTLKIVLTQQTVQRWLTRQTEPLILPSQERAASGLIVRTAIKAGYEPGEQIVFVQPPSYH